jgi:hypothetical protein
VRPAVGEDGTPAYSFLILHRHDWDEPYEDQVAGCHHSKDENERVTNSRDSRKATVWYAKFSESCRVRHSWRCSVNLQAIERPR